MSRFREQSHKVDCCIVGGGMAGLTAAIAAARRGTRVALMHDRPVLGGNASSECRMHICGADRHGRFKNMRETGVLEELRMENLFRNPNRIFSIWDTVLYEKVTQEPNITLLLNCSCLSARMRGRSIASVTGWQTTTQTMHTVEARIFVDSSGDAVLAPLTGAPFRMGREARKEYGESIAPVKADARTMGMTCLFQSRRYPTPQPFEPPAWAHRYESCDALPYGEAGHKRWNFGYWWVELGGEHHSIHDTEALRDELLKVVYGVWDHIKNRCAHREQAANWALDWVGFLPAKRESRRYIGAHVLTQHDIEAEGRFDDIVAYGGWSMDDHHPAGFRAVQLGAKATIFHPAPSPYGIPYRCLYSAAIPNLMFAGRNISCTHAAMSSTRVMGTCCSIGQAVGTAAALAIRKGLPPAGVGAHIGELQQNLLRDDAYLPWTPQRFSALTMNATLTASSGNPEPLRNGINRPVGRKNHRWPCRVGDHVTYAFAKPVQVDEVTIIVNSAMNRVAAMCFEVEKRRLKGIPAVMPRTFRIEGLDNGRWRVVARVTRNIQRLVRIPVGRKLSAVRFVLEATWGARVSSLYAFYVN